MSVWGADRHRERQDERPPDIRVPLLVSDMRGNRQLSNLTPEKVRLKKRTRKIKKRKYFSYQDPTH